jgi:hypothetical protein
LKTVEALVEAGADQNTFDDNGISPIAKARKIGNAQLLQVLEKI